MRTVRVCGVFWSGGGGRVYLILDTPTPGYPTLAYPAPSPEYSNPPRRISYI